MQYEVFHLKNMFPFLGENDCDPTITVYIPDLIAEDESAEALKAGILILPGGGYSFVSSREGEPIALNFLQKGYRVFVLNYSVAPNRFPTALREVAASMEFIHSNAYHWALDVNKIAIMGFSAGGHLAGHYSNCFDCPEVRAVFPESKPVNAAVLCYPVITCDPVNRHIGSFRNLLGVQVPTQEDIEKYSLDRLVSDKTPPTFLWHTREDLSVSVVNTLLYAQALAEQGTPFSVHIYPFGGHGLATADNFIFKSISEKAAIVHNWMEEAARWLSLTL